jgi:hypothetical protein
VSGEAVRRGIEDAERFDRICRARGDEGGIEWETVHVLHELTNRVGELISKFEDLVEAVNA